GARGRAIAGRLGGTRPPHAGLSVGSAGRYRRRTGNAGAAWAISELERPAAARRAGPAWAGTARSAEPVLAGRRATSFRAAGRRRGGVALAGAAPPRTAARPAGGPRSFRRARAEDRKLGRHQLARRRGAVQAGRLSRRREPLHRAAGTLPRDLRRFYVSDNRVS